MSDFGVTLIVKKKSQEAISSEELANLNFVLEELKSSMQFTDSLGQNFLFAIIPSDIGVNILLSEYWLGDETEEEIFDFTDSDKDEAEKIV